MVVLRTLALALLLLAVPILLLLRRGEERPPNIVVITVESLRTDHVGFQDGSGSGAHGPSGGSRLRCPPSIPIHVPRRARAIW